MRIDPKQLKKLIKKCQRSPAFFINNFCHIEHPKAGIIPFRLFDYQINSINAFLQHKLNIYRKTRQCGISTLTGAFALWYAMFFGNKTILIVSKRDLDAKDYLKKNVKLAYDLLPDWMREVWYADKSNVHELSFPNGSKIKSLTSSKETLRSHASSLNIIDEAAFMPHMDEMWCVGLDTIVKTARGDIPIRSINVGDEVITHVGSINKVINTYRRDNVDCLSIKTKDGHGLICGTKHWLMSNNTWNRADSLQIGDIIDTSSGDSRITAIGSLCCNTADIALDGDHSYLANDIISHNSGGWPTLQHGGSVIVISTCVDGDTFVTSDDGVHQIKELSGDFAKFDDQYYKCDIEATISTDEGFREATNIYKREPNECLKIATTYGTELVADQKHAIKIFDGELHWTNFDNIAIGDYLPVVSSGLWSNGNNIINYKNGPDKHHPSSLCIDEVDAHLAYMMGIILAEGYINENYVVVAHGNDHVRDFLRNSNIVKWVPEYSRGATHSRCLSKRFVIFLQWFGFKRTKAPYKEVPKRILTCTPDILAAFLRGMFDGDGFSKTRDGMVGYCSTSFKIISVVKYLLGCFGIFSNTEYHKEYVRRFQLNEREYESACKESYIITIKGNDARNFYKKIGFDIDYKQSNLGNLPKKSYVLTPPIAHIIRRWMRAHNISISKLNGIVSANKILFHGSGRIYCSTLKKILEAFPESHSEDYDLMKFIVRDDVRFEPIKTIESIGTRETYDFTIPNGHKFLTNGIISHNTKGVGNWYWRFWTDAEAKMNDFNPIVINWWDMTWRIEYYDELTKQKQVIAPTRGIRRCTTKEEIEKYGPYRSPWLEREYRNLTEKGDDSKFRQEVLADFIGTGHTVLSRQTLTIIGNSVEQFGNEYQTVGSVQYVNPVTGERDELDFHDDLWVWKKPVLPTIEVNDKGEEIVTEPGHLYILGADTATGEGNDFSAIEVFDLNEGEQVAELRVKVRPKVFAKMIDYIGRWYNNASAVVENTGIGKATCQELYEDLAYPNMYRGRRKRADLKFKHGHLGFATTGPSKLILNKSLIDGLGEDGYTIYSGRFHKEAMIYVQLTETKTGAEPGPGNTDDLIIACALALVGISDVIKTSNQTLIPYHNMDVPLKEPSGTTLDKFDKIIESGGARDLIAPIGINSEQPTGKISLEAEVRKFQLQMGGIMASNKAKNNIETIKFKKNQLDLAKKSRRR